VSFHTDMQAMTIEALHARIAHLKRNHSDNPLTEFFISWAIYYINQKTKGKTYAK